MSELAKHTRAPSQGAAGPCGDEGRGGVKPSVETAVPSRNLPAVWQEGASRAGGEAGAFPPGAGREGGGCIIRR